MRARACTRWQGTCVGTLHLRARAIVQGMQFEIAEAAVEAAGRSVVIRQPPRLSVDGGLACVDTQRIATEPSMHCTMAP